LGSVFIIGEITDIVVFIFDAPMASGDGEQLTGVGFVFGQAGDAIDGFGLNVAGFDMFPESLDADDLTAIGEANVIIEISAGPDAAEFQTAVAFINSLTLRGEKRP
jgi:hypothetical protein